MKGRHSSVCSIKALMEITNYKNDHYKMPDHQHGKSEKKFRNKISGNAQRELNLPDRYGMSTNVSVIYEKDRSMR